MHEKEIIRILEQENRQLKEENGRLRKLIMEAGLSLSSAVNEGQSCYKANPVSDHRSSAEGVLPVPAAEEIARLFYKYFWGRTDVFAKRFVSKKKDTAGYFPQCGNFWRYQVCPKREGKRVKCTECSGRRWIPFRGDGLEKTNYMIIGPIRHRFTSKERAEEQGIAHLVYPRFTRLACPRNEISHINEAYELVKDSETRNEQIIADVINCVEAGRTPVILTKHREHAKIFYEKLADCAAHVILMLGEDTKKQKQEKLTHLHSIPADESMILIGTGKLIGEGFDYPRLDTLIMAAPVSGAQVVEQYAGRLNRDYEGKKNVIVYDYVDLHIPKLNNMYAKRLKAYKQIGYQLCTVLEEPELTVNAIYDFESYAEVYENDLRQAKEHIVISSPQINHKKVERFINTLKPKQEQGIKVTIVTWNPDYNKYGSTGYRMSLLEKLRDNGFSVQLLDADCRHYTVVDHRLVWYGNLNFLGKEDIEDNLMRVESADIAAELLAQTFGRESEITMW